MLRDVIVVGGCVIASATAAVQRLFVQELCVAQRWRRVDAVLGEGLHPGELLTRELCAATRAKDQAQVRRRVVRAARRRRQVRVAQR